MKENDTEENEEKGLRGVKQCDSEAFVMTICLFFKVCSADYQMCKEKRPILLVAGILRSTAAYTKNPSVSKRFYPQCNAVECRVRELTYY